MRTLARFFAALQLLPALESGEETLVGGQAVMEGVMMRTPHAWGNNGPDVAKLLWAFGGPDPFGDATYLEGQPPQTAQAEG